MFAKYAGFFVGNVDAAFDAGSLLQQRLFVDNARRRIRRAIRAELLGARGNRCGNR
jgi:hypothetical protein